MTLTHSIVNQSIKELIILVKFQASDNNEERILAQSAKERISVGDGMLEVLLTNYLAKHFPGYAALSGDFLATPGEVLVKMHFTL